MSEQFDLAAFEKKVLWHVEHIQKLKNEAEPGYEKIRRLQYRNARKLKENSGCAGLIGRGLLEMIDFLSFLTTWSLQKHRIDLTLKAEEVADRKDVKLHLCPALQGVESEPLTIAKIITPILAPLAGAQILSLPLDAELFAMLALVISSKGVAEYCVSF